MADLNELHGTVSDGGGNYTWQNPTNANDGTDAFAQLLSFAGAGIVYTGDLETDLGAAYPVSGFTLDADASCTNFHDPASFFFAYSDDGSTWTNAPATTSSTTVVVLNRVVSTWELDAGESTHRYWRLRYQRLVGGFECGVILYSWEVTEGGGGDPDPEPEPDPDDPYEPPEPNVGALLEIYVAEEGAYLWDVATWDDAIWSTSGWTDITYLGVMADVSWGADNAERGILAPTAAGVWTVDTHDPDRILDPANAGSPYHTELVPGLPIRISVAGRRVLRTGIVDTMAYSHAQRGGRIRATDKIAVMAAADVSESDLGILPDTLYARAQAAIEAAGIDVTVSPVPSTGDPSVATWDVSGDESVWTVIAQSALETLRMPYLNEHGVLYFRRWLLPADRGMEIASPELIDLTSFVSADGLYSAVRVNDATAMSTVELAITPPPAYGRRLHDRTVPTISGEVWADTVLADRSATALRWRPGQIRPLTAERVVQIGSISHNELVTLYVPEANPDVEVRSRILGTNLHVIDLGGRPGPDGIIPNTQWRFTLQATTAAVDPLVDDDDLVTFLVDDDDGVTLLYPDGVAFSEV